MAFEAKSAQVIIKEAFIIEGEQNRVDIRNLLQEIIFYEDLNKQVITGEVTMSESLNLLEAIPILSQETLLLTFEVPYIGSLSSETDETETRTMLFDIFSVTNVSKPKEKTHSYKLNIASMEYNQFVKLGPVASYKASISDIVESLYGLMGKEAIDAPEKEVRVQTTNGKRHIVFPALSVAECLKYLCKMANNTTPKAHVFKSYENARGFHFRSIEDLISRRSVMHINYTQNNTDSDGKVGQTTDSAISYEVISRNDTSDTLYNGGYRANQIVFDPLLKKIQVDEFNLSSDIDSKEVAFIEKHKSQTNEFIVYNSTDIAETFSYVAHLDRDKNSYVKSNESQQFKYGPHEYLLYKNASENHLKNTVVSITIAGTTRVAAGDMIEFDPPQDSDITTPSIDKYLQGRYLVQQVEHIMTAEQYIMNLTCLKSGLPNQIEVAT